MTDGWLWTFALGVAVQLVGFGVLFGSLRARVVVLETQQAATAKTLGLIPERLARIESTLEWIKAALERERGAGR